MSKLELSHILDLQVKFMEECWEKLCSKKRQGYTGWDNPENKSEILHKLMRNLDDEDYIDVANLAMMLWGFKDKELDK